MRGAMATLSDSPRVVIDPRGLPTVVDTVIPASPTPYPISKTDWGN